VSALATVSVQTNMQLAKGRSEVRRQWSLQGCSPMSFFIYTVAAFDKRKLGPKFMRFYISHAWTDFPG